VSAHVFKSAAQTPVGAGPEARAGDGFVRRVLVVAAIAAGALALWKTADVLLVVFGGVLLAVALRACADLIAAWTPLRKRHALPVAVLLILVVLGLLAWAIGGTLAAQLDQLLQQLPAAFSKLREWLGQTELGRAAVGSLGSVDGVQSAAKLVGVALGTLNAVANLLLLLVVGIYLAADPGLYFRGSLRLLPKRVRPRASAALSTAEKTLRRWLGGQLVAMLIVGTLTFIGLAALGVPLALSLATIAGLLEFVPFVGPILAAIPALLMAFTVDPATTISVALLYFAIQQVEGYVLMPLVQRWAVALPPALGAVSVVVFAVLFGLPGVFFAVPLTIVVMVLVQELYLERELLG
jgi:predicted PurR-regulated permease PerM